VQVLTSTPILKPAGTIFVGSFRLFAVRTSQGASYELVITRGYKPPWALVVDR
jgi:hypothetical protein